MQDHQLNPHCLFIAAFFLWILKSIAFQTEQKQFLLVAKQWSPDTCKFLFFLLYSIKLRFFPNSSNPNKMPRSLFKHMDCWINQCHTHVDKHQSEVKWQNLCGADLADLVAHALPSITVHHAQGECLWSRSHSQSKGASAGRSEVRGPVCSHSSTESLSLFTVTSSKWLKYWLIVFSIKKKMNGRKPCKRKLINSDWRACHCIRPTRVIQSAKTVIFSKWMTLFESLTLFNLISHCNDWMAN